MKKLNFISYIFLLLSPLLLGTSYAPMDFFYKVKNSKKIAFNGKLLKNVDYDSFQVFSLMTTSHLIKKMFSLKETQYLN